MKQLSLYRFSSLLLLLALTKMGFTQNYRAQLEVNAALGIVGGDASVTGIYAQPVNLFAQASSATGGGGSLLYNVSDRLAVGPTVGFQTMSIDAFGATASLLSGGVVVRYHFLPITSRISPYAYGSVGLASVSLTQDEVTVAGTTSTDPEAIEVETFTRRAADYSLGASLVTEAGLGFLFSLNDKLGLQGSLGYSTAATSDSEVLQSVYPTSTGNLALIQVRAGLFFKLSRRR